MTKVAITVCATKSYAYAMCSQASRVVANIYAARLTEGMVIIVGDNSKQLKEVLSAYQELLPPGWKAELRANPHLNENHPENYKAEAQLLIGNMRQEAFSQARKAGADFCWSLDSDVLPPPNALRCSLDMLGFDGGYYSIAQCPYPNTSWLGGRGSYEHPIEQDFLPHEKQVPWKLMRAYKACENRLKAAKSHEEAKPEGKRMERLQKKMNACPPDGSIWEVIAKHGWRRRGWLDFAYPGIGIGAVVPVDWCGFGCTLMNKEALSLALFDGYDGLGTEDLFVIWKKWTPAGLRIACVTHCPCSHVIWEKKKVRADTPVKEREAAQDKFILLDAYHEPRGEAAGHLRYRALAWTPER